MSKKPKDEDPFGVEEPEVPNPAGDDLFPPEEDAPNHEGKDGVKADIQSPKEKEQEHEHEAVHDKHDYPHEVHQDKQDELKLTESMFPGDKKEGSTKSEKEPAKLEKDHHLQIDDNKHHPVEIKENKGPVDEVNGHYNVHHATPLFEHSNDNKPNDEIHPSSQIGQNISFGDFALQDHQATPELGKRVLVTSLNKEDSKKADISVKLPSKQTESEITDKQPHETSPSHRKLKPPIEKFRKKTPLEQMNEFLEKSKHDNKEDMNKANIFSSSYQGGNSTLPPNSGERSQNQHDLFMRKPRLPPPTYAQNERMEKIDHDAIRQHSNSYKLNHIEADLAREARRRDFARDWRRNNVATQAHSSSHEISNSYRQVYLEHLEKSLETKREIEGVKERRANKEKYGEIVKSMNLKASKEGEYTSQNSLRNPHSRFMDLMNRERKKSEEVTRNRYLLGNQYMKFCIEEAKKDRQLSAIPKLQPIPKSTLDQVVNGGQVQGEEKKSKATTDKQSNRKYNNIHEIFNSRDKHFKDDDKNHNYSKIAHFKKIDDFKSHTSQALAAKTIRAIDQNLKEKEKKHKEAGREGELDQEYVRSIKTKLEVLNHRLPSEDKANRNTEKEVNVKQRIQSAAPKPREESKDQANPINKSPLKPMKPGLTPAIKKEEKVAKTDPPIERPIEDVKQKVEAKPSEPKKPREPLKPVKKTIEPKPNLIPKPVVAPPKVSFPVEAKNKEEPKPDKPNELQNNSSNQVDPLIRNLSKDLDEDQSAASVSLSNQQKKQQELNDYFHKRQQQQPAEQPRATKPTNKSPQDPEEDNFLDPDQPKDGDDFEDSAFKDKDDKEF